MKKLITILTIAFFSSGLQAQYLDVTDIYFANAPYDVALPDTGLTPGAQVVLHFKFTNNLSNQQDLNPGDKISFAWHTVGTSVYDTLGTMSWPAVLPNGQSATLYAHDAITLPQDPCKTWEVCIWPAFNPYAPNTDPTKGKHCTIFRTSGCTGNLSTVDLTNNNGSFYIVDQTLYFQFPSGSKDNKIELYDLTGKRVLSEAVSTQGELNILNENLSGLYLLKASNNTSETIQKVLVR